MDRKQSWIPDSHQKLWKHCSRS